MSGHLQNHMDFSLLRQMAKHDLIHLLESTPGQKDLAIEPSLMKPMDKIANMSLLVQHGVGKIYQFSDSQSIPWAPGSHCRVYFVKPTLRNARHIAVHVRADQSITGKHRFMIVFVPRRLMTCEDVFEEQGIFGLVDIRDFNWSLLQLDSDMLSLELPEFAHSSLAEKTNAWTHTVSHSLWHLQSLYGSIDNVYGIGKLAKDVHKLTEKLFLEMGEPKAVPDQPISHAFLFDRKLDYASVLLTGLTYDSMLNDCFGINCGKISFGDEVESKLKPTEGQQQQQQQQTKSRVLSGMDEVYSAVRDTHMANAFAFLSAKAKNLQASYDKGQNLDQVSEMKHFVSNELRGLKDQHKALELHICASEVLLGKAKGMSERLSFEHSCLQSGANNWKDLMSFAEDWMCQQLNQWSLLMLMSLYSICQNGLPHKEYQSFRTQFLHAYGHNHLLALYGLKKIGLLTERPSNIGVSVSLPLSYRLDSDSTKSSSFQFVARRLNLFPKDETKVDLKYPSEMSYVFSGAYTPALCQIVSNTLTFGWNGTELGKTFGSDMIVTKENKLQIEGGPVHKTVLVYFLAGVTYAEIAALRLLSRVKGFKIIIATTHIIQREAFIKMLADWRL